MLHYLEKLASNLEQEKKSTLQEVGSLVGNVQHISEIVAMQQSYAKPSGLLELLSMTDLMDDALIVNREVITRHAIEVQRDFRDVPTILTDKHKVLQILVNLIRNAGHACGDSKRKEHKIILKVLGGNGCVTASVIDNGVGIPPENLTRVFSHGFTTRKEGHGLGLHSGALAAKEMNGSLVAFSDGPDCGSIFTLELPLER